MIDVNFAYSESENGWASDEVLLTGNIVLLVNMKDNGIIVIKKRNGAGEPNPKVYISKRIKDLSLNIKGDTKGCLIQVLTTKEPNYIRYANIWRDSTSG